MTRAVLDFSAGWGVKIPYGSSKPPETIVKINQKYDADPYLVFQQIVYWTRVPLPVHQRTIATVGTNLDDIDREQDEDLFGRADP